MKNKFPWSQAVINSFIIALLPIGLFHLLDYFNHVQNWEINPMTLRGISGLVTLVILGIGIYVGMEKVKKEQGDLSYKEAIQTGILISLITAVIISIFTFLYCTFINPSYANYLLGESKKAMINQGLTESVMRKELSDLARQLTTPMQVVQAFVGQLVGGTLISLILGLIVRTKSNQI